MNILLVTSHRRFKIHFRAYPWAEALSARGHSVDVMCHADASRWKTAYESNAGFRIVHNPDMLFGALRQGWDPICALRRMLLLFREKKQYDIIHCLDTRPAVILPCLAYARAKGIPIVSDWIDWWGRGGLIKERRPIWYRILFGGFETFFEEHFRNKLDGLTTISSALLERGVALGVPRERCIRIPGGANLSAFSDIPTKAESRGFLRLSVDVPVVCFSGLDVLIDLALVLSTFERVLSAMPNSVLLLVGPTPKVAQQYARNSSILEHVVCTGPVSYRLLPKYLAAADVFLMPYSNKVSNRGRWPNKIGDYMCIGRPTVSNPVGEVKDLFRQFDIGVLAKQTPHDIAVATLELLRDNAKARAMGQRARAVAEKVFAWEHLTENLEKWYGAVLSDVSGKKQTAPLPEAAVHGR